MIDWNYKMPSGTHAHQTVKEVFFGNVEKESSGCWNWVGKMFRNGYGCFQRAGTYHLAHRASWQLHNGEVPSDCVCHKCDNRRSHL